MPLAELGSLIENRPLETAFVITTPPWDCVAVGSSVNVPLAASVSWLAGLSDDDDPIDIPEPSVENVEAIECSITELAPAVENVVMVSADADADTSSVERASVECVTVESISAECVEMVSSVLVDVVVGPRPSILPLIHCSAIDRC
jgi:hypothetical protein